MCSEWGECLNNSQTRTCTDTRACNTTTNKPETSQACESIIETPLKNQTTPAQIIETIKLNWKIIVSIIGGISLIIVIVLVIVIRKNIVTKKAIRKIRVEGI